MIKIIIKFRNKDEVRVWIIENLTQEDSRYLIPESFELLIDFIYNEAIVIEEHELPEINEPSSEELSKIPSPQSYHKYIGSKLLQLNNFKKEHIKFEYPFYNRKADVYVNQDNKKIIIECCSCNLSKPIEYLEEPNTELWVITQGFGSWENFSKSYESLWFILRKGENWDKCHKEYNEDFLAEIKKIQNPLDAL